jgi:hypothetical protein
MNRKLLSIVVKAAVTLFTEKGEAYDVGNQESNRAGG